MLRSFFSALIFSSMSICSSLAMAEEFTWSRFDDVIGQETQIVSEHKDTLYDLGMAHDIGFNEMRSANPDLDPWLPGQGKKVVIPSRFILPSIREGVVINLREYRLYFFPEDGSKVITYPVGIGAEESPSPVVSTRVKLKIEKPNWYPPESARIAHFKDYGEELDKVVYPGPDNPLGPYAIQLDLPEYFIHGTNKAFGIGTKVSRGCIRLDNKDMEKFVWEVPKYTPVRFVKESVKVGVEGEDLLVELHLEENLPEQRIRLTEQVLDQVGRLEKMHGFLKLDFLALSQALRHPSGLPQKIGTKKAGVSKASLAVVDP